MDTPIMPDWETQLDLSLSELRNSFNPKGLSSSLNPTLNNILLGPLLIQETTHNNQKNGISSISNHVLDKKICDITYKNDVRHGRAAFYHPDGKTLSQESMYENDIQTGPCTLFHPNGQVSTQMNYENGVYHGPFTVYSETLELILTCSYDHGVLNGPYVVYSKGKPVQTIVYNQGVKV